MMVRRLILEVDGQGGIELSHDNFAAPELAAMALILQDKALDALKNGVPEPVKIKEPPSDGPTGDIPDSG